MTTLSHDTNSATHSEGRSIARGAVIVSALTQLSRVFGLIREILTARLLGTGFFADAYVAAFRIPNLFRSFVAEGAMTSAFVPVFAGELVKGKTEAQHAINVIGGFLLLLTSALTILGVAYAPELVSLIAPGFSPEKRVFCETLTRIMFPFIILISLTSMLNGILNSVKIFGSSSLAQVLLNIVLIIGASIGFFLPESKIPAAFAWSVIVGGFVGVLSQIPALRRAGFHFRPQLIVRHRLVGELILLMIPAIFGAAVYQITITLATLLASLLSEGAVASLYYADRVAQLPIGIFTVALGSVLLPSLSKAHAKGDLPGFKSSLAGSLRYTSFLMVPIGYVLFHFSEPITRLLFEGGNFSHKATHSAALALAGYSTGLWAVSCHSILMKAFLARKDTVTPTLLGVLSLVMGLIFSLCLMGPPTSSHGDIASGLVSDAQGFLSHFIPIISLGHVGLALASGLAASVAFISAFGWLAFSGAKISVDGFLVTTVKTLLATACAALLLFLLPLATIENQTAQLAVGLTIYTLGFVAFAKILRANEIEEIIQIVLRKLTRR